MELTIYLLGTFYALSNYSQFHEILVENQIGDATMKILEYQIKRGELFAKELRQKIEACIYIEYFIK